jgi:uncharacterized membrane protein YdjX (TVP38/TMEM64 family)
MLDLADPERPLAGTMLIDQFLPEIQEERRFRRSLLLGATITIAAVLLGWQAVDVDTGESLGWVRRIETVPLPALTVPAVMAVASLLFAPLNLLLVATGFVFGFVPGVAYAALGVLASSVTGYGAGRTLGRAAVRAVMGTRGNALSRKLLQSGRDARAFAILRILPIASASGVNLVCGAARLRFGTFLAGTLLGTVPALLAFCGLGTLLRAAVDERGALDFVAFAAYATLVVVCAAWLDRHVGDHVHRGAPPGSARAPG